jgi:hypothetical protein
MRLNENSSRTIILDLNERHFNSPDELSKSISYDFAQANRSASQFLKKRHQVLCELKTCNMLKEIDVTKGFAKMINM